MNRSAVSTVGTVLVAFALTACGSSGSAGASLPSDSMTSTTSTSPTDTTSASPTTSLSPPASPTSTSATGTTRPVPPITAMHACRPEDLGVAAGRSLATSGHVGVTILFRNVSRTGCTLEGYPGVAGLDAQGHQAVQATRSTNGYLGGTYGVRNIMVAPGASASAMVEGTDVPSGMATSCATYPALLVTAPGHTDSHVVHVSVPGCSGLQVHPVVVGTSGRP